VFGNVRWGVICIVQAARTVGRAVIARARGARPPHVRARMGPRPTLPGEQRFMALVAANACAILAPEWVAEGPPATDRTRQRELAQAIRAGEADERWNDVLRQVRGDVRAKLAVAHPRDDDFADDGKDKEP
jgi:Domain of unknown function (DUF6285)